MKESLLAIAAVLAVAALPGRSSADVQFQVSFGTGFEEPRYERVEHYWAPAYEAPCPPPRRWSHRPVIVAPVVMAPVYRRHAYYEPVVYERRGHGRHGWR